MVELQHDDVRLTAVDAWVVKEVGDQLEPVCAATLFDLLDQSCLLSLVIPVVSSGDWPQRNSRGTTTVSSPRRAEPVGIDRALSSRRIECRSASRYIARVADVGEIGLRYYWDNSLKTP